MPEEELPGLPPPPEVPEELKKYVSADRPTLMLNPIGHILCPHHGEPYRAQWPTGFASIIILGTEFIQKDNGQIDEANRLLQESEGRTWEQCLALVLEARPICERVSRERLHQMYMDGHKTGLGTFGLCENCGRGKLGTPFRYLNHWGRLIKKRHICFDCVLDARRIPKK